MKNVINYYDALAIDYDQKRFANSYGRYVDTLERNILTDWFSGLDKHNRVDFGCGTGRLLDFAMIGVDGSALMLQEAKKKFPDRQLIQAGLSNIPLADNSASAAFCFHVLMHLDSDTLQSFLNDAARIISFGGRLIIDIPSEPRRSIGRRVRLGWHGNTSANLQTIQKWTQANWRIKRWQGILFFPIHRIPPCLRSFFMRFDALLGKTWLARYSSYYVIELVRII